MSKNLVSEGTSTMHDFFYRLDFLALTPGSKKSGFVAEMSPAALRILLNVKYDAKKRELINDVMRERVLRSGLLPDAIVARCVIAFIEDTACPHYFAADPSFGGSIGAQHDALTGLSTRVSDEEELPVSFTPHNIDTPAQALAIVIMIAAWGEFAHSELYFHEENLRKATPISLPT